MILEFPLLFQAKQQFPRPKISNLQQGIRQAVQKLLQAKSLRPGESIALTAGSRGIAHLDSLLKFAVQELKAAGGQPIIVPAMGSHGGATASGQTELLAGYGVTPEACGCPIRSSMETVVLGQAPQGFPIHFDRFALEADHVLVVNRIKPHTMFVGDIESGLMKMLLIGLGKHQGALVYHRAIQDYEFGQIVRGVGRFVLENVNILGGIALVENAFEETALIEGVLPNEFEVREAQLLQQAKEWLPRLPFDEVDVLIVDEIGKNISGTGMDTNVIGRKFNDRAPRHDEWPKIRRIVVRALSEETHGNACGIGIADACHRRVLDAIDRAKTATNCITAGHMSAGAEPISFSSDREMLSAVLGTIGLTTPAQAKVLWIRNTLHLSELKCSAAYWESAKGRPTLVSLTEPRPMEFDDMGNLVRTPL